VCFASSELGEQETCASPLRRSVTVSRVAESKLGLARAATPTRLAPRACDVWDRRHCWACPRVASRVASCTDSTARDHRSCAGAVRPCQRRGARPVRPQAPATRALSPKRPHRVQAPARLARQRNVPPSTWCRPRPRWWAGHRAFRPATSCLPRPASMVNAGVLGAGKGTSLHGRNLRARRLFCRAHMAHAKGCIGTRALRQGKLK